MRRISLKARLTLWYTILMVGVSAIVLTFVTSFSQNMINKNYEERIVTAVDGMMMQMRGRPDNRRNEGNPRNDGMPPNDDNPPRDEGNRPPNNGDMRRRDNMPKFYDRGVHMVVLDENKNVIGGQIPFSITDELDFREGVVRTESYDGNRYLVYDKELKMPDNNTAYIKGFISIDEDNYAVASVVRNNLILTAILILIAAIGGYFIASRALAPVGIMNRTAKSIIKSKDLSKRINVGKSTDEISELAQTLDEMLDEIQSAFEREQQFTSDASHELRTPIAVIMAECEYMLDCAETVEELKGSAESIKEETERMSKLVSELLTISRMDRDTLKLDFEKTDLSDLVNFVCGEQEEINDRSITLERNIAPDITANTDRFMIARLFVNLISNAYKYNSENGKITVSLYEKDNNIVFSVSDTGIGIRGEDLPKIWERFYQVDPSRTANENGSMGLGLSMVKWIAEKHGGFVTAESEIGKGSTFTFVMPE